MLPWLHKSAWPLRHRLKHQMDDLPCSLLLEVCLHLSFRIQTHAALLQKLILFCAFPFSLFFLPLLAICLVNKRNTFHSLTRGHLVKGEILVPCSKACAISLSRSHGLASLPLFFYSLSLSLSLSEFCFCSCSFALSPDAVRDHQQHERQNRAEGEETCKKQIPPEESAVKEEPVDEIMQAITETTDWKSRKIHSDRARWKLNSRTGAKRVMTQREGQMILVLLFSLFSWPPWPFSAKVLFCVREAICLICFFVHSFKAQAHICRCGLREERERKKWNWAPRIPWHVTQFTLRVKEKERYSGTQKAALAFLLCHR